jgi:hypothetical protein
MVAGRLAWLATTTVPVLRACRVTAAIPGMLT